MRWAHSVMTTLIFARLTSMAPVATVGPPGGGSGTPPVTLDMTLVVGTGVPALPFTSQRMCDKLQSL